MHECPDRTGHDELYKGRASALFEARTRDQYVKEFEGLHASPFWRGGSAKGYVRGLTVEYLMRSASNQHRSNERLCVLDAGCGQGELSVYLAAKGFRVIGVDVSGEAVTSSGRLAEKFGVLDSCHFLAATLEALPLDAESCDYVIGHGSLHHFIKYNGVPSELNRILKPAGEMFFADAFGENPLFRVFHDGQRMARLGDVLLKKGLVEDYFQDFEVTLHPTDWFVMLDKLFIRLMPARANPLCRRLSWLWWHLDRLIPVNRFTLALSGSVMTHVRKRQ